MCLESEMHWGESMEENALKKDYTKMHMKKMICKEHTIS